MTEYVGVKVFEGMFLNTKEWLRRRIHIKFSMVGRSMSKKEKLELKGKEVYGWGNHVWGGEGINVDRIKSNKEKIFMIVVNIVACGGEKAVWGRNQKARTNWSDS